MYKKANKKKRKKTLQPAKSEERDEPDSCPGRHSRGLPSLQHPAPPPKPLRVPSRQHYV